MSLLPIRYVSFDCYGTLIDFRVGDVARDRLADRVPPDRMAGFLEDFTAYRFDFSGIRGLVMAATIAGSYRSVWWC